MSTSPRSAPFAPSHASLEIRDALEAGDEAFALRLLRKATLWAAAPESDLSAEQLKMPPVALDDARWDLLVALLYAHQLGARAPSWATARFGERLPEPWFPADPGATLRRRAETGSPALLRQANIFIDERGLSDCSPVNGVG